MYYGHVISQSQFRLSANCTRPPYSSVENTHLDLLPHSPACTQLVVMLCVALHMVACEKWSGCHLAVDCMGLPFLSLLFLHTPAKSVYALHCKSHQSTSALASPFYRDPQAFPFPVSCTITGLPLVSLGFFSNRQHFYKPVDFFPVTEGTKIESITLKVWGYRGYSNIFKKCFNICIVNSIS